MCVRARSTSGGNCLPPACLLLRSHAFSVLYSGSSAFIRPSFGSAGPAGAASSHLPSSTSANLPPTPPPASTSAAGSYGSSSVPQGNSSGSRTVLRMRAQAAPARERERDGSPPAAGPRLRSPRSPRSSLESTPGGPGSVSLPPLPPAPGSGPGAAAHDSEPGPSHAGSASHMQRGTCGNSLPPMAGQSAAGGITASAPSLEHWGAMSPAASLGDGPWSPCEVPTAGYAVSAAAAAAAAGWGDLHECGSSLDGNSDDGTCSHFQRQPGASVYRGRRLCSGGHCCLAGSRKSGFASLLLCFMLCLFSPAACKLQPKLGVCVVSRWCL